jgi:hypothetical protein
MSATLTVTESVTCMSDPTVRNRSSADSGNVVQSRLSCEPERRLWKLIAESAASTFATCQLFLAVVFLAAALLGIATSFAELARLLEQDAIRHIVEKAITASF